MAIGRISGPMLRANLERQGVDLSIETDLLYVDVNNNRIGVNQSVPAVDLDVNGTVLFKNNLQIDGTTISSTNVNGNISVSPNGSGTVNISTLTAGRVVYAGTSGALVDSANLTFDGNDLSASGANIGNISIAGNTISVTNLNGNVVIDPAGSGTVNISTLTSGRVLYSGTNGSVIDSANLVFDGSELQVTGIVTAGNLSLSGNTLRSENNDGNIVLDPNGVGNVVVETAGTNQVFYSGSSKELLTSNAFTYNGTALVVDNISISGSTISNTDLNGNLTIDVNGTGVLIVDTASGIGLPAGTTLERPIGSAGYFRYNSDSATVEFHNGTSWLTVATVVSTSFINVFDGDGSTTQFTLTAETSSNDTIVTLNGVIQSPGNAYTIIGTTMTFTEPPQTGDSIEVRFITDAFSPGSIISDADTSIAVDDASANIVSQINGSNVVVTTTSSTTFSGSILGIGSISSITTSVPASSSATGTKGQIAYDASYVYICVDTDTWIRSSIQNAF